MYAYSVFGGRLHSELELPELRRADDGAPDWTLRIASEPVDPLASGEPLGEEEILTGAMLRLHRRRDGGYRLDYSDSGVFDISPDGSAISWHPAADARVEYARTDLMGRVLSTSLHAAGALALHASGAAIDGQAVGFLAPKFFGKSTLAIAMTYAGAALITDDTLAIIPGTPPLCLPGVHSVRLRSQSAAHFPRTKDAVPAESSRGRVVDELPEEMLMRDRAPLAALYLLAPTPAAEGRDAVTRQLIPPTPAAMAVLPHARMGGLFRAAEAATNFDRVAAVVRSTPVYTLNVVRDLARVREVAEQIVDWHRVPAAHL
jgi:hypothetical protein